MGDKLIEILDEKTALTKNTDLFYLEMPLHVSGLWVMDYPLPHRYNGVDTHQFNIYYRGKDKQQTLSNVQYLTSTIDSLSTDECKLDDGTTFKITLERTWEYVEKDSEGYYVFTNLLRLML